MSALYSYIFGGEESRGKFHHHRFESFAPVRQGGHVKWYVDGKDYFFAVSEALSHAQSEIFIEDWWLSPELYLRRPPNKYEDFRLDRLLKRKAEEGVKIHIVVYKEMPKAMELDSAHSKETLSGLHENIIVQRHPDHLPGLGGVFFWAHHEKICVIDRHIAFIGGLDLCFGRYDTHYHQVVDFHKHSSYMEVWPGQDYSNPRVKDFVEVRNFSKVLVDKKETARMPWHDVSIGIVGRPVQDIAKHFIQRWNFIKKSKAENKPNVKVLVDKSDAQYDRENPPQHRIYHAFGKTHRAHHYQGSCNVQILRSSAKWSHGIQTEHSILNAYIETIKNAKHFIYIENQFFVTATKPSENYAVKNQIGAAIVERVLRAAKHHERFRIIVCMPLLPSFQAEIESGDAGTLRLVMHYQYMSISRGGYSIFDRIKEAGVDPAKYISFYALRAYDRLVPTAVTRAGQVVEEDVTANYVTEELYIHTKLLIADDHQVIIGSANLNDRSQLGDHDSEIAAYIEDHEMIDSRLAGKPYKASKFAATLRRALFKEHLGLVTETDFEHVTMSSHPPPHPSDPCLEQLSDADRIVEDPASDEFYDYWQKVATTNTESFRAVFHCVPDDTVTTWTEYKNFVPAYVKDKIPIGHVAKHELTLQEVKQHLGKVQGHLVHFPTRFMEKEKLEGSVLDPLTPMEIFI